MSRKSAIIFLIITGVLWSTGGLLIKLIPWTPISIAGIRSGLAALVIYFYSKPKSRKFGINIWAGGGGGGGSSWQWRGWEVEEEEDWCLEE